MLRSAAKNHASVSVVVDVADYDRVLATMDDEAALAVLRRGDAALAPEQPAEEGRVLPIPYDFDMSGIVDAPHSAPNARFGLRNVRHRLYRGRCANNEHLSASIQAFREHKPAIYDLVGSIDSYKAGTRGPFGNHRP